MDKRLDGEYDFPITRTEEQKVTDRVKDLGYLK